MSNYILLMQFRNISQINPSDASKMMLMSQIGSGVSLIGSVMTLSILCFLSIKGDGLFIVGNMSLVMMAAQLSFIGAENTYPTPMLCKIATYVLLYFFLAVHFSSLCYGLHLWSRLNARYFPCRKRNLYLTLIWIVPLVIVTLTSMCRGDTLAMDKLCWLPASNNTRLAFLLPVSCILLLNLLLYCQIVSTRFKLDYNKGRKLSKILKNAFLATLSMFPVLNLPWLLGYSVTFDLHKSLQYLYVLLCSSQGLLVLALHVLTTGQVKKGIFAKLAEVESDFSTSVASGARTIESEVDNVTCRNRVKVEPKKDT